MPEISITSPGDKLYNFLAIPMITLNLNSIPFLLLPEGFRYKLLGCDRDMPNNKYSRQRQRRKEQMKRAISHHHRQQAINRNLRRELQLCDYAYIFS